MLAGGDVMGLDDSNFESESIFKWGSGSDLL
jgi:hypothetical protein